MSAQSGLEMMVSAILRAAKIDPQQIMAQFQQPVAIAMNALKEMEARQTRMERDMQRILVALNIEPIAETEESNVVQIEQYEIIAGRSASG